MSYTQAQIAAARKSLASNDASVANENWLIKKEAELRKAQQDHQSKRLLMFVDLYMEGYNVPDSWRPKVDAFLASMQQPTK